MKYHVINEGRKNHLWGCYMHYLGMHEFLKIMRNRTFNVKASFNGYMVEEVSYIHATPRCRRSTIANGVSFKDGLRVVREYLR